MLELRLRGNIVYHCGKNRTDNINQLVQLDSHYRNKPIRYGNEKSSSPPNLFSPYNATFAAL